MDIIIFFHVRIAVYRTRIYPYTRVPERALAPRGKFADDTVLVTAALITIVKNPNRKPTLFKPQNDVNRISLDYALSSLTVDTPWQKNPSPNKPSR